MEDIRLNGFTLRAAAVIPCGDAYLFVREKGSEAFYTVGGAVHFGESTEEAVIREAFEETGMMMQIQHLLFVQERFYRYQNAEKHELCFYYLMETPGKPLRMKTDRENERLVFLSKEDLAVKKIIPVVLADTLLAGEKPLFHLITHE